MSTFLWVGIIVFAIAGISITAISAQSQMDIPQWVKNNAIWWGEGQISDSEFMSALQFLINQGLLKVGSSSEEVAELEEKLESMRNLKDKYQQAMIDEAAENERLLKLLDETKSSSYQSESYSPQTTTKSENYPDATCYGNAGN